MPFITEEIWQTLPGERPSAFIMQSAYPVGEGLPLDEQGAAQMEIVMDVVRAIRNIRGEMDVPPSKQVAVVLDCKDAETATILNDYAVYVEALGRVGDFSCGVGVEHPEQAATQVAGDVEVLLPLAGLVNLGEEEKRLTKEIAKAQKDVDMFTKKLSNDKFVANAPAAVLEKDRGKLAAAEEKLGILQESLKKIQALM